jgi:hypothetical protein
MKTRFYIFLLASCVGFANCSITKNYNADKKYTKEKLQEDYTLLRNILEKKHPSLYWYTPKDSMNKFFDEGYQNIKDSMTELQFGWKVLAPITNKIHCGHTSFSMSKSWNNFIKNKSIPSFPLYLKVFADTMVISANLNSKDSVLKKGTIITSINGIKNHDLVNKMFEYLVQDGYSDNVNYLRLSSNFPYFHRNIFGLFKNYSVQYIDKSGIERTVMVPFHTPRTDSLSKKKKVEPVIKVKKITRKEKLENIRSLRIDSNLSVLAISGFTKGNLRTFFRRSFKKIRNNHTKNLVIDIRGNGGGDISKYVALTKYIRNTPFKVSDTAYSIAKSFGPYTRYIKSGFFNNIGLFLLTKKRSDGKYHFGYWERHSFRPKRNIHFNGNVFVLTNGLTFSASSLFCNVVKGQKNVTLVGEETGGGWYGNSGIMIPDITLPNTKLKVRLPVFRLVQYHHIAFKGTGVIPDIPVGPTVESVRKNIDLKMKVVKELIGKNHDDKK